MKFETENLSQKNVEKIGKFFPNCITEAKDKNGKLKKAIDFEILKQMLSDDVIDESDEKYEFTWVGKKAAMVEANKPIKKTLRPCKEESKDWDNTENLYIEGDNLEVLKLLQESYLNSIKMIYIDPPYNTGNDFIYNDDFKMDSDEYKDETGEIDEEGNRLFKNTDSNGRFHSDWCSMMYSRLMLARNLLSEDGVIFISIDDNEQENLKNICSEIFGANNYVGEIIRKTKSMTADNKTGFNLQHESAYIYSKNYDEVFMIGREKEFKNYSNPDNDPNGEWCVGDPSAKSGGKTTSFGIKNPYTGRYDYPPKGRYWAFSEQTMNKYIKRGKIKFKKEYKDNERGFIFKRYKNDAQNIYEPVNSLQFDDNKFMNQTATVELKSIFNDDFFSYPKPVVYIKEIIKMMRYCKDVIILDFFSGSATTAHAVMDLNAEDGGNRKFIMIQLPEKCDEKSEAYKSGYKNICEIGKERIRRAGEKIKADNSDKDGIENLDTGFRVFKLDETNMKDVYYAPDDYTQDLLERLESNIKEDRTELDLLYGCLIEWGIPLNKSYESKDVAGSLIHIYNDGDLIACFDENISEEAIKIIAKMEPLRAVFRDSSFKTSANKINVEEIFKLISPDTSVRVI